MYEVLATLAFAVYLAAHFMALLALRPLGGTSLVQRARHASASGIERAPALSAQASRS